LEKAFSTGVIQNYKIIIERHKTNLCITVFEHLLKKRENVILGYVTLVVCLQNDTILI